MPSKKSRAVKTVLSVVLLSSVVMMGVACSSDKKDTAASPAGSTASVQPDKIVELKAVSMGVEPASGLDNFYKQLDELTKKDLGATIRFTFIPWGDEKNQISRSIVAKEYDIYVGGAWSDFKNFALKNAYADLKPFLSKTPKLVEHYQGVLDRVTIDGKLFGIPQLAKAGGAGGEGMLYREDLRKKWGLPEIKDLATVEQYLYKAKQEFPDTPMINDKRVAENVWRMVAGGKYVTVSTLQGTILTVAPVSEPYKVISIYDTPEYKEVLNVVKKWYDDKIIAHDILAAQGNETSKTLELMKANKKPLEFNNHFGAVSSGYIPDLKSKQPEWEFGWFDYGIMYPNTIFLPKHSVETSTMISVGAHSKNVETALKFIEKAHTDRTYFDLLMYGVLNENYKLNGESVSFEGIDPKNKKPAWTGLNDQYMNRVDKYPGEWQKVNDDLQAQGAKLVSQLKPDPYEGFVFNTADLAAETSSMETVRTQYAQPLAVGMVKKSQEADLQTLVQQLKGAGYDKYISSLQKQLDEFAASKKK